MEAIKSAKFDKAVIDIKILNNKYLLVVDSLTTVNYLDADTFNVVNKIKANAVHERYVNNVVYFSTNAEYLALITSGAKESKLYNIKTKKMIASVNRHQGDVSCVAIDPKDRYMFSGGDDGITFGVDIKRGQLAFTLPRHIDTINDIAFSKNGQWVATASYDKNIVLFSLMTMTPKERLKVHSAPVMKVQFLSQSRLLSIDKNSSAVIWDVNTLKIITRIQGIHDDVTKVAVDDENEFLFLGTRLGYIIVYSYKNYDYIAKKYLKFSSTVTALTFDDENKNLLIGTDNGDLFVYNIFEGEDLLYEAITYKNFPLLQEYIEKNPMLVYTKAYEAYEILWERTVEKARELIESGDKQKAMKLFDSFMEVPLKKQLIQKLLDQYRDYDKFLGFIKQNKLALAYGLANANPFFKDTKIYKSLELKWKKSVVMAQKYLLNPNNIDKVKEIFVPYRGIAEKTAIIQDLLTNSMVYNRFKDAIAKKDFKLALQFVKRHSFLKESAEYNALMGYSDNLYIKAQQFQKKGDTHSAIKMYNILINFDDFKDEAKFEIEEIENKHKFFSAFKDNDILSAYNLLDVSESLQLTKEGKVLQQTWEDDYNKAGNFAARGDVEGIKNTLEKYMNIKSKQMSIATIMSWCYITELNIALKKKMEQKVIEKGIKNYILYFGLTDQITTYFNIFSKEYHDTKLNLESQVQGSMEKWRPSMIVKNILD